MLYLVNKSISYVHEIMRLDNAFLKLLWLYILSLLFEAYEDVPIPTDRSVWHDSG